MSSTTIAGAPGEPIDGAPSFVTAIEEAVAVGMAAGKDRAAVAWITHDEVSIAIAGVGMGCGQTSASGCGAGTEPEPTFRVHLSRPTVPQSCLRRFG